MAAAMDDMLLRSNDIQKNREQGNVVIIRWLLQKRPMWAEDAAFSEQSKGGFLAIFFKLRDAGIVL